MTEEKKYSERAAEQIKQLGQIIGTMLVTKVCYEHDGIDTTAIDKNIEDLKKQMAQTVRIMRACMEQENNDIP